LAFLDVEVSEPEVCEVHYWDLRVILPVLYESFTAGDIPKHVFLQTARRMGASGLSQTLVNGNINISFTMFRSTEEGT
jgi:hypothetical protein